MSSPSLQERLAPDNRCFGCGPANERGLRIRSFPDGDDLIADWQAQPHHEAWEGMVNGGIVGALTDCHGNWAAAWHLMKRDALDALPSTVTADFHVRLKRPTPSTTPLRLRASIVESDGDRVVVDITVESGGKLTATTRGTFVRVREGHPAYHRW